MKKQFLNKNAMNTAKGFKKVEHAKVQPKHIDIYLDAEAEEVIPERTDLKRDEANVRPESKYYKDLDPMKLGGVKVSGKPKVFSELMATTGSMNAELQKHHLQRASYRLSGAKKKQSFEDLLQNYFHVNALDAAKEQLNQLLNTPIRPLSETEMTQIEGQLKSHDARLLNDTNALMHIIFDSRLREDVKAAMTNDQWSKLLKYALLSMYQRTAQIPPEWLGGDGHTKDTTGIPTADPVVLTGNIVKTDTGETFADPMKTDVNQKEASDQLPKPLGTTEHKPAAGRKAGKMGFLTFYRLVLHQLRQRADLPVVGTAHNILSRLPSLPQAFGAFIFDQKDMQTLDPDGLNARTAVGVIREAFVWIKGKNRQQGYTLNMLKDIEEACDDFFFRQPQSSGETPP